MRKASRIKENNKLRKITLFAIVIVLSFVSLGYAALSSNLSILGTLFVSPYKNPAPSPTPSPSPDPTPDPTPSPSPNPASDIVCKRATALHTEVCNQSSYYYCSGRGHAQGEIVSYGKLGIEGATLEAGDALDCDANGDGTFDAETERFYYISDLDTNPDYAVLVYYNNVVAGEANNTPSMFAYDPAAKPQENGPVTAAEQLPTTEQWSNVSLASTTRKIKDEKNGEYIDFDYAGKAARLLTAKELESACEITVGSVTTGELDNCEYLMENTRYTTSSLTLGYWLETVHSIAGVLYIRGDSRRVDYHSASYDNLVGVRPAIEVLKSKISS